VNQYSVNINDEYIHYIHGAVSYRMRILVPLKWRSTGFRSR